MQKIIGFIGIVIGLLNSYSAYAMDHLLMSYDEYNKLMNVKIPYVFSLSKENQFLYYFGGNHSYDQSDNQYIELKRFWKKFLKKTKGENCIVLVEGGKRIVCTNKGNAISKGHSEGGYITYLASKHNVKIKCPEPPTNLVIDKLSKDFCKEVIAYKIFAQALNQGLNKKKIFNDFDLELYVNNILAQNQRYFEFENSLETMKTIHTDLFKESFDLYNAEFYCKIVNPIKTDTIINQVIREESLLRDKHILNYINALINEGKNIFIVFGFIHAIMQEKAIKALWDSEKFKKLEFPSSSYNCMLI